MFLQLRGENMSDVYVEDCLRRKIDVLKDFLADVKSEALYKKKFNKDF